MAQNDVSERVRQFIFQHFDQMRTATLDDACIQMEHRFHEIVGNRYGDVNRNTPPNDRIAIATKHKETMHDVDSKAYSARIWDEYCSMLALNILLIVTIQRMKESPWLQKTLKLDSLDSSLKKYLETGLP